MNIVRGVGNFTGISYDMKIINDTKYDCVTEDPFSQERTIRPGYQQVYFITPSFSVKVAFKNPDGSSTSHTFIQERRDMAFKLSDYYTSHGKVIKAEGRHAALFEFEGGAAANFEQEIVEQSGTRNFDQVKKAIQAEASAGYGPMKASLKGQWEHFTETNT